MTDGERARLNDWQRIFAVASTKVVSNSIEQIFYAAVAMTLGAILEDRVHYNNLMEHINRLKSMGVEPATTEIMRKK